MEAVFVTLAGEVESGYAMTVTEAEMRTVELTVTYRLRVPATWAENWRIGVDKALKPPPLNYIFADPSSSTGLRFERISEPDFLTFTYQDARDTW